MKRKINFTKRRRILREDIDLVLERSSGGQMSVRSTLKLQSYAFPDESRVYLEAYRLASLMRFSCGTVGELSNPYCAPLTDLDGGDAVAFRVKVVDETTTAGKILGVADRLRPSDPSDQVGGRKALLPTRHADLEEELWHVSFETVEQDGVVLEINLAVEDRTAFVNRPEFRLSVLPGIVREVLTRALVAEEYGGPESLEGWRRDWITFVCQSVPNGPDEPPAERDVGALLEWIDSAVAAFARSQRCTTKFLRQEEEL